ncbi:variable charge X-linked protein 3B-like [Actinia tenebrosa]|uniref:Variable charge X-linked protein 3B-like n=1 Tax=Actinia tenebrosa TaxID=6105 RepID=A0A6P8HES1_ACTTE|nr:variable charge X-linked protein 3B-like [Actinia tenebrosa]
MRLPLFLVLAALVITTVYAAKDEVEKQNGEPLTAEEQDSVNDESEQQDGEPLTQEQDPMNDENEQQNGEPLTQEQQDQMNDESEQQDGEPLTQEQDPMNDEAVKRFLFSRPKPKPREPKRPVGPKLVPKKGETLEKDLFIAARKGKL